MVSEAFYSVILAGGSGTRLWPLSRAASPKFLHALTGTPSTLLQATMARLAPLSPPEHTFVVTGGSHAVAVSRQLPQLAEANVLVEPSPRDSCAAIGLAAAVIARHDPDAVMGSFASDHLVRDGARFVDTIRLAIAGARAGWLMTVGLTPTHAETGYGYLERGEEVAPPGVFAVTRFKEKPSRAVAEEYLRSGHYLWNASMFVWHVEAFLNELRRQQPELAAGLARIAGAWATPDQDRVLGAVWPGLAKISVDHAVMEGAAEAGLVAAVPGDFGWTDVGDFDTLGHVLAGARESGEAGSGQAGSGQAGSGEAGNVRVGDPKAPVLLRDSSGVMVVAQSGRLVATLGVRDLVVVDTPDVVLVCARGHAQHVKSLVDELRDRGEERYL